jgi:hypothetical protein
LCFSNSNPSADGKITTPGVFESPPPDDVSYYDDVMYDMYYYPPTDSPTIPFYKANEYETDVPDFAEHDDFFEAKPVSQLVPLKRCLIIQLTRHYLNTFDSCMI